jgi:formate C-acetyltransferase
MSGMIRTAEAIKAEKASLLEDAHYWKGRSPREKIVNTYKEMFGDTVADLKKARIIISPEARPITGRVLDYGKVIEKGLNGIMAEAKERIQRLNFSDIDDFSKLNFLKAVIIACEGAITFANRHAKLAEELAQKEKQPVRKKDLEKIAEICKQVPENPAADFYKALQSFWLTHLCANLEVSASNECPGRMDQYLYPYYRADIENGKITRQEAAELMGCLWVKFAEMDVVKGVTAKQYTQTNQGQNLVIGGVTREGRDATNELTYLILEVTRQLKTAQPSVYIRCHKDTPEELWMRAVEVNRDRRDGQPAFLSDQAVFPFYLSKDLIPEDARDWGSGGCVYPITHFSIGDRGIFLNLAKVFELMLNNGVDPNNGKQLGPETGDPRNFKTFDALYDAFKKQLDYFVDLSAKIFRLFWQVRRELYSLPFTSALIGDCIENGRDYLHGGARYPQLSFGLRDRGHQNTADSLTAIKKLVFEEKKISMPELLDALSSNFEGKEDIQKILKAVPKYGNDDDYADAVFNDLSLWTQRRMAKERHPLGTAMSVGRGGATIHYFIGKNVGALPDGRKAGEPLADGTLSPMRGVDVKGPTAVINSASKVNHTEEAPCSLFNMKLPPNVLRGKEGLRRFAALIKTYFDRGGYHLQFNLMGQEVLFKAKKHPEKYRDLLVRVAGYSAYFVDLSPEVQDDVIARMEHKL